MKESSCLSGDGLLKIELCRVRKDGSTINLETKIDFLIRPSSKGATGEVVARRSVPAFRAL